MECVNPPELPLTLTPKVPGFAELLTLSVNVVAVVEEVGLNDAVTPPGRLEAEKATLPVNPFVRCTVIVDVPELPRLIVTLPGEAERLKLGAGFTVKVTVVVCVRLPEVAVIDTVAVPVLAKLLALNVTVLLPVAGLGPKAAVTPLGKVELEKVTLPVKPLTGLMVMALEPRPPWVMVTLLGEVERPKSGVGTGFTVRETVVDLVTVPLVPEIVMV